MFMTTLIVSDVHLGSSFNKVRELSAFIRSVSFSRLIILGDLFDKPSIKGLRDEEWEFLDIVKGMSRRREIIWVEGNHDEGLYDTIPSLLNISAVKEYEWSVNGKKLLAIHGHQFDRFSTNRSILASCAGGLYRLLRRIDIMLDDDLFHRLCFENESWKRSSSLVNEGALDYASERDAKFVFCGHTHRAGRIGKNGVEYFNTGCWSDNSCHYVVVDGSGVNLKEFPGFGRTVKTRINVAVNQAA